MSSENKSLDPSDHGPSTPLSSTGGRTPSPAPTDRRPRGRPRKDAGSGLPTPRKKGRSRGRAQVEDEDSMDGTETAEAENMQDMEVKELVLDVEEEIMVPSPRDDRPLSPLFQRSVSEDSAGSSASTLEHAKVREKLCAFCYCGERSFLGQGDLMVFGPTPGYVPLHIRNRRGSSEKDDDYHEDDFQDDHHDTKSPGQRNGRRGLKKVSSPDSGLHSSSAPGSTDPFSEELAPKFWDELGQIGLPDDINVQSLFDPTGQCCAHLHCAAWSEGVCCGEAQDSLLYVDKAIDSGSTECCAYCKRLGASIKCCEEGCCRSYHFPCAAAAGTFQDLRRHTLLCPDHLQLASQRSKEEVKCLLCGSAGDLQDLLFCSSCGQHYHGACLDVSVTPLKRAGWQCPECKVCLTCRNPGEDSKMLVCDMCDKGYHTFCLQPTMKSIPTNGWRCKNCRVCSLCGVRQAGQWAHNITLCEGCHGQPEEPAPALPCPLCVRGQGHGDAPKDLLLTCHTCKRWLHGECEKQAGGNSDLHPQADYMCTVCKQVESDMVETPASPIQESTEPEPEPTMDVFMAVVEEEVSLEEEEARPSPWLKEEEARPSPRLEEEEAARPCPRLEEEEEARPGPLKEPKVSPSGVELAQEIQVTVTLTEGRESPQRSGTLADVSPLASQSPASPVDDFQQEVEISDSLQTGKGAAPEEALPCDVEGEETKSEDSKTTLATSTKEIAHEPLEETTGEAPVEEEEPMQVAPVEMKTLELAAMETTVKQNVMEPMQEVQDAVAEKEVEEKLQELEDEELPPSILDKGEDLPPIVLDEGEVLLPNVLPIAEDTIREKELSPMAELPEMESPVDMDTTVEMDIMPASNRSLSDFSSLRGEGKAPKASPEMSSELSLMLNQSLVPTESFPREASPPWAQVQIQAQAAPPQTQPHSGYSACVPPTTTTFFPLTPKIGMGKPAISKRKFSPGRPRVKQGRGSDFPGRRRPRGANLSGRGGRGRSRGLKADTTLAMTPGASFVEQPYMVKEEEENAMHNTVVMFSTSDHFTLRQDMCVVCGSFGQGSEGRLLACSQCGQCYHPFCVNIKITRVVLSKGWRCLECTVCEACGQASDPGRLLLCDNCDISYHTYCLDPPLQTVPKGSWKCKWCVSCTQCGATSPGMRCDWQNNYTQCGPCASLASCPMCMRSYREDELIVQCRQCDRWIHACCQGLDRDEEVENAADDGFDCTMCRMHALPSQGKVEALLSDSCEDPMVAQIVSKTRDPDIQKTYTQDGVCLTESGLCQLESLAVPSSTRRGQNRRPKPKLKLKIINQNSVAVLQTPPYSHYSELSRDGDGYMDDRREGDLLMDCDLKSDSSPEREPVDDDAKGADGADGNNKRKRKPYRPGIGGFMVRQRSRTGQGKAKRSLSRKYSTGSLPENPMCKEEGWNKTESTPAEETPPVSECLEKVKKRYRKKRTKLEEEFPLYLQEAFFGKELLDKSKQSRQAGLVTTGLCEENSGAHAETKPRSVNASFLDPFSDPMLSATSTTIPISSKGGGLPNSEDPLVDLPEVLSTDADLLGMLSDDLVKQGNDSAGLDMAPISDDPIGSCQGSAGRGPRALQEEPLDVILSPELDKMVADGAILSKLYKIPELEGKDVEDLFTAVLSPSTSQPPQLSHPGANGPGAMALPNPGDGGMFPRMPMINGMMGPNPHFPPTPMMPGGTGPGNFSPIHRMPFQENMRDKKFSQMGGDVVVPWSAPVPGPLPEGETDTMSNAQRSTLKWEKEETLGEMATVAPVLYTNVNFPNLLGEFPDWAMRVKQIAKLWRKASSQDRAPYVQKARDNRAALRINKVQMSNDTLKRHQNPHQQPLTDPFDPNSVPMDAELLFKDALKPKESEHEQEWKFRQGELNQMWGPLKTQQEKVPKSKAIKSTNKDVLFGHSNQATIAAGGGKMSLQMRQKCKQQAKIEATQKLEQVKNEQQQLQQQQQQQQLFSSQSCGDTTPNSGNQSPMTPQPSNGGKSGNSSPLQPIVSKDGFARSQLPVTPTSGSQDDVFLRPQLLPSSSRTPTQETSYPQQGPSSEPQSPQMFSPSSSSGSRPSSPWDPYAKIVGTPRPPPVDGGSTTPQQNSLSEMQERGGRPSPAHESFGSPTSGNADPYAKMPDTPRPPDPFVKPMGPARVGPSGLVEQQQKQQVRHMMSPPSGGEAFARIGGHRAEVYQRMSHNRMILSDPYSRPLLTPIPGSNESGSVPVFKAPMPPQQSQQEPYGGPMPGGLRRGPSNGFPQGPQADPYVQQPLTLRPPMGEGFPNEPRMMRQPQEGHFSQPMPMMRHPHRNSYAQAPSTPRPDYSQQMPDPYVQPPGTPRPHSDGHAQPAGTPRPHSDPSYLQTPPSLHLDQFPQQHPANRRQSPSHSIDPYASMPGTPRPAPGDRFPKSPASQRNMDPYAQQPGTHRPSNAILYVQPPGTPRPLLTDPYSQASGTPRPGAGPDAFNRLGSRPIPMSQLPADPFSHQSPGRMQDTFAHPSAPGSQISKHPEMSDESFSLPQSNHQGGQTPIHDPFEQGPMTPCVQASESSNTVAAQNSMQPHLGDTEEKLRQRQRLRQLILRQQQQKTAIRQEKGLLQEAGGATGAVTPRHWSQEDPTPQSHMFGRPPPPYPGPMRGGPQVPGGQRFPGTFLGDQRGPFPNEGQFAIPHFPRDMGNMGLRPQGMRFGFPSGQEQHFLRPPQQMPGGPMVENIPPQMRRSPSVDFSRGGNPQMGLPQDFPPRGLTVQQHNIMGQPFIELRHRAPENRMKIPFGHGPPDVMDPSNQTQRPPQCFMGGQEIGFARNQGPRTMDPMMGRPSQGSVGQMQMLVSMENLHQQQTEVQVTTEQQQHPPLNRSLSHPVTSESLNAEPSGMLLPGSSTGQTEETQIHSGDGIDENLDADDSAVKDLEDVEVKDLVDLNLNLDPDDGKDLDLGPNDLHLDAFLMSGKFDLIAYTDPELNLDDKKDMFSEDLDLGDPMEEHQQGETSDLQKALSEKRNASGDFAATSSQSVGKSLHGQIRRETNKSKETLDIVKIEETIKTEVKDGHMQNQDQPLCSGRMNDNRTMTNQEGTGLYEQPGQTVSAPVLSNLLVKEKLENTGLGPNGSPHQGNIASQPNQATGLHPNTGMQHAQDNNRLNPSVAMGHRVNPALVQSRLSMGDPNHILGGNHCFGASANQQVELNLAMVGASQQPTTHGLNPQGQQGSSLGQAGPQNRPLLLDEQPLLLQDLLDQERQEQQQQRQMQAMIRQRSSDSFFPNIADFDAVTDPIMKAKMVALKGINKVMAQNNMGMPSIVINSNDPLRIQHTPGAHGPDAAATLPPHVFGQDGKLAPQMARPNPPNFGPGFVNDGKRKQYEEWLKETQQLLQMQQKFLEDQIGAHRKSKKALSAKQRTAKKAGREFPKEDVEQLKHVTEQQSVVQKQLEQIRKQQKDHAELIEEYRVKQQQLSLQAPMMPGMPAHAAPMMPRGPPLGQPMMTVQPHPSQPNLARMPDVPGWHPGGAPGPMGGPGPRIPAHMPPASPAQLPPQTQLPPQPQSASMVPGVKATPAGKGAGTQGASGGGGSNSLAVKFDDNNPFSEGFQERERRDRMREQQERQRVQLMQEVDRHRAMQQRLEMEQQGLGMGPAGLPHGSGATNPSGDSLAHMPFYNTDLPQDFMQPSRPQQQAPPQQGQLGPMYPQQGNGAFMLGDKRRPMPKTGAFGGPEMGPNFRPKNPMLQGLNFPSGQPRPARFGGPEMMPQGGGRGEGQGPPFGMDSSTPLPPNYPGSGQSLIQLYSNIIPEEKVKKKRNRKKKRDSVDDTDSVKTPSTPHSDRCSPLTPSRGSDTSSTRSLSIPGEQDLSDLFLPVGSSGLAPSTELERQLSGSSLAQGGCSSMGSENDRAPLFDKTLQIKLESIETECRRDEAANEGSALQHVPRAGGTVKVEEGSEGGFSSPLHGAKGGDTGNELLKHLLKNKSTPPPVANANQTLPTQQMSCDKLRSEQEDSSDRKATARPASTANNMTPRRSQLTGSTELLEPSVPEQGKRKQQRNKLMHKNGVEKPPSRYKRRKKEEEEKQIGYSSTDTLMTQLKQQLSLLPLIEPLMGVNFAHFPPFGSGQLNGENNLSGSFGSASLGGVSDYYSQLIYKQNNLSNPPTPPASLPPTPPPVARQKMVNGFATVEELTRKAAVLGGHDGLKAKQLPTAFQTEKDLLAHAITQGPKTVDVPASLPTPPHNNQEELRSQDHCADRDTPDSFVPSSSPESVVGVEISRYPDLSNVKEEPPSPCSSPVIPMLPSASGKGTEIKREVKTEPSSSFFGSQFRQAPSCSKAGLVTIAITLNPVAAENIPGMVAAVADLLCVNIPVSYEVSRGPERSSLALLAGVKVPQTQGVDPHHAAMFPQQPPAMRFLRPPGPPTHPGISQQPPTSAGPSARGDRPKPQWCWNCKVLVLGNGVRKSTKDLPCSKRERPNHAGGSMVFCSHNCFVLHATATQSKTMDSKPNMSPLLPESSVKESPSKVLHQYSNNMSTLDVHCLAQLQPKQSPPSSPRLISFPSEKPKPDTLKVTVKFKPRPRAVHSASGGGDMSPHHHKRWKGLRWRKWSVHIVVPTRRTLLSSLPSEDEMDKLLRKLGASLRPDPLPRDLRRCCFCHEEGDGVTDGPARLLNLDLDLWVHLNCALWSSEVYETQAGALINVELALRRGMAVRCAYCQQTGATSRCHRLRCANAYHFTCALKAQCTFFKDKTMLCHLHRPRGIGSDRAVAPATNDHELRCFAVFRRVYVQRDEARQMASIMQRGEHQHTFRVGSLVFHTVGQLLPQQMAAFHSANAIFPVGYRASRIYWSTRHGNRRCRYLCSVEENEGRPEFVVRVMEQGYDDLVLTGASPKGVWDKILEPVAERRNESGTLKLFPVYLKGEDLFGFTVTAVTRIVESLPGVEACESYTFRFGRNPLMDLPLAINPTGSARSEPKTCTHVKRSHTLSSTGGSSKSMQTVGSVGVVEAPEEVTPKQFASVPFQYRRMKAEWKSNVYLARSRIQGLGLYAARDIESHTMVIEYIGTLIRNEVANRMEKMYESQNRGVYMFRLDSEHVVDATITGGPARYINHSCAPNCITEAVSLERGVKIVISSCRNIQRGEELCYDYKFDLEDDQHKIPCHCGAVNCRKWMN